MEMTKILDDTIRHFEGGELMRRYPIYLVPKDILDAVIEEQSKEREMVPHIIRVSAHVEWRGKYLIPISAGVIMPVNDFELSNRLREENKLLTDEYFIGKGE